MYGLGITPSRVYGERAGIGAVTNGVRAALCAIDEDRYVPAVWRDLSKMNRIGITTGLFLYLSTASHFLRLRRAFASISQPSTVNPACSFSARRLGSPFLVTRSGVAPLDRNDVGSPGRGDNLLRFVFRLRLSYQALDFRIAGCASIPA